MKVSSFSFNREEEEEENESEDCSSLISLHSVREESLSYEIEPLLAILKHKNRN